MSRLEGERATAFGGILLAAVALWFYIGMVPTVWNFATLTTLQHRPLATDFSNYWSAARLALSGKAAAAYDINELYRLQLQAFGTHVRYGSGWYYPPTFLLAVSPLGLFSYVPALIIWITVTLTLYFLVLSRLHPHPVLWPLLLLFPGLFENFLFGQSGYLTAALLGGGLLLLDGRPLAAGCLFGLLTYKPHLVILVFPALILGRHRKALLAAAATSLLLILISVLVFGYQTWLVYFQVMAFPLREVEIGSVPWGIMPTCFAAVRSAGGGVTAAYLVQGVVMLVVAAGVAWVWRKRTPPAPGGAVLVMGTVLFTPYAFVYDLAVLALPLVWLWEEGRLHGRLPGELLLLGCGWLAPAVAPILWDSIRISQARLQLAPVILLALFLLSLVRARRAMAERCS